MERKYLKQYGVLWASTGRFDDYGDPIVSDTPTEFRCRWEPTRSDPQSSNATSLDILGTIFMMSDPGIGSCIWLGRLADLTGTGSTPESDVMYVNKVDAIPDAKARVTIYEVSVTKRGSTIGSLDA